MSPEEAARYERANKAIALAESIRPLLAGLDPRIQGAALADLTATWIAQHPDEKHEALLALQIDLIRRLLPTEIEVRNEHVRLSRRH